MDLVLQKSQEMIGLVFCNLYAYNIISAYIFYFIYTEIYIYIFPLWKMVMLLGPKWGATHMCMNEDYSDS